MQTQASHSTQIAKVQAVSGLIFSLFLVLHLMNTALAAQGEAAYNGFQRALRPIYQSPIVEVSVVLLPLMVHLAAGIMRMRARRTLGQKAEPRVGLRTRLHRYSGYFLALFVFGHIAATRLPGLLRGTYPEFMGLAYTFQFAPYYFYPYYSLLALAGLYHMLHGGQLALGMLRLRVPNWLRKGLGFWVPTTASAILVLLGVAGLGGLLFSIPDASHNPYARLVQEMLADVGFLNR